MLPFTSIDAATQGVAGLVYLLVGIGAWLKAPHDPRTRVFLSLATASFVTFEIPAAAWLTGVRDLTGMPRSAFGALIVGFAASSVALFHFCQVFPSRRPWVGRYPRLLLSAYVVAPAATAALVAWAPASVDDITIVDIVALLFAGVPLVLLFGIVLPVAGVVSLVKSYREARETEYRPMRRPLGWLLVSQIAGGTIALVFAPVLATVAPGESARTALTIVSWAFGLLTPAAFALAVWTYRLTATAP